MADQHNSNIPDLSNLILDDVPDIKENLEYHKDVFENFVGTWSDTVATGIYPNKIQDSGVSPVALRCLVLSIGDWNMDSTASVAIAHGLTLSTIRAIDVMVISDDSTLRVPLLYNNAGSYICGATNVALYRTEAGSFDSTDYNATTFNRGYIMIWYTA